MGRSRPTPATTVPNLPERHIERDWLRRDEIALYVDACSEAYRPLAEVLIATGMRISEALGLRWDDVDYGRSKVIRVYRQRTADGVGHTKSRRFRSVSVGDRLLSQLRDLHARQAELRADDPRSRYVFVTPERRRKTDQGRYASTGRVGEPINRRTVSRAWHKAALQDAGPRDMPLHALRHTAAASWLLAGQPLIFVQRQLGHSSITITERYYGHLEQGLQQTAANETEATIWGVSSFA